MPSVPAAQPDVVSHRDFFGLSLADLSLARSLFHVQLLDYPNVIGTALGRYLIRVDDDWPTSQHRAKQLLAAPPKQKPARRLDNSEIRPYSWPCVLAFVSEWIDYGDVATDAAKSSGLLPRQLWLPDGRVVPVCVVEAKQVKLDETPVERLLFPGSFFGAGYPVSADVQGRTRLGTIGPLVTDGQRVYALTSRHVLGTSGSDVNTFVHGSEYTIGSPSATALTRVAMSEAYPKLAAGDSYLNVDVGLIDVDDADRWTSVAYGLGPLEEVADAGSSSIALSLIGRPVIAHGAAGGAQRGQVKGLLYRYKSVGGAEYFTATRVTRSPPGPETPAHSGVLPQNPPRIG